MLTGYTFDNPPLEIKSDLKFWKGYLRDHIDQVSWKIIDDCNGILECVICKSKGPIFSSEYRLSIHLHLHVEITIAHYVKTYLRKLSY